MKQIKFFTNISVVAAILFMSACNSGSDKKAEDQSADTSTIKAEAPPVANAPGPTSLLVIRYKVANYERWKTSYESNDSIRLASGLHKYVIARGTEDSNAILVAMKMDDVAKAKAFTADPALKQRMKKGGIVGPVSFDFTETVMNDTTAIDQTVRVMVNHKVKDWDTWKKSFDSHKQARTDAGLIDRVIGYTVGNNHQVTIVFAVTDISKAKAFMQSKDLKDKMAEAGVEGPPTIFFYKVAAKY